MYCVYVIYSVNANKYYVGHTNDINRRIQEHNFRQDRFTSNKGTWKLVYKEEFDTRSAAMQREKFLKSGKGREYWRNKLLAQSAVEGLTENSE
jgi:putative endonuclease